MTYYLEREHLFEVLRSLSETAETHSRIAFDYIDRKAFDSGRATAGVQKLKDAAQFLGEPMKAGLDPQELEKELMGAGWDLREDLSSEDIEEMYFRGGRVDSILGNTYISR